MATTKLTVTVPEELAGFIRAEVDAGRYDSVSEYITRAALVLRDLDPLDVLIASMIAESGPPTEEDEEWAANALAAAGRARLRLAEASGVA